MLLLLLELGLRVSEAVGANIEDLASRAATGLEHQGERSGIESHTCPAQPVGHRRRRPRRRGPREWPLLITGTGARLTRQHAGKLITRLGEQIGLPHLHPHQLRHTFVTPSLDEGASLRDVQDAARQADPRTTRRYDRNRNSRNRHPTHRLLGALEP